MVSKVPQLNILSGETVERKRFDSSQRVKGRTVKGSETISDSIQASVQPVSSSRYINMIQNLPEGQRLSNWIQVYCELDSFRTIDDREGTSADILIYDCKEYEVKHVSHRRGRHLNHDFVLAVLKET